MANKRTPVRRPVISERIQLAQIKANERIQKHSITAKAWCRFWDFLKVPTAVCGLGFFGYLSIKSLAGQTTGAEIAIKFFADIKFLSSIAVGGGGLYYGQRQKKLREDYIKNNSKYTKNLELLLNPNREGSKITETGNTREEDR